MLAPISLENGLFKRNENSWKNLSAWLNQKNKTQKNEPEYFLRVLGKGNHKIIEDMFLFLNSSFFAFICQPIWKYIYLYILEQKNYFLQLSAVCLRNFIAQILRALSFHFHVITFRFFFSSSSNAKYFQSNIKVKRYMKS